MNAAEAKEAENGDESAKVDGAVAEDPASANGEAGKTPKKTKESLEYVDEAVALRIKEAQNSGETKKKFAAVLDRFEESVNKVRDAISKYSYIPGIFRALELSPQR